MKNILLLILLGLPSVFFSQIIILQEDFTNYMANTQTVPQGWTFSSHDNYTSIVSSGSSGPNSYKFGADKATISAPAFSAGTDSLKFWIKGNGTDSISALIVLESADSLSWDTLAKIVPLPTTAAKGKRSFPLMNTTTHLQFKYIKKAGNLAFDDFKILKNYPTSVFNADNVENYFSVYPNPSTDGLFTIERKTNSTAAISIYNIAGEIIKTITTQTQIETIDLSGLQAGVYFMSLQEQNNLSVTKKICIVK